jgi:hypothetical protein
MLSAAQGGPDSVKFRGRNGEIAMHTPVVFEQGTSLVHVDIRSNTTADFLMIPYVGTLVGKSLKQIMDGAQSTEIYGPQILNILETIGWPSKRHPELQKISIVATSSGQKNRVAISLMLAILLEVAINIV